MLRPLWRAEIGSSGECLAPHMAPQNDLNLADSS
jgi:hypothetical protein